MRSLHVSASHLAIIIPNALKGMSSLSNQSDLNHEIAAAPAEDKEKIERMNRIRQSLAQAEDPPAKGNTDLPQPAKKNAASDAQKLDISVEDNPPPMQSAGETHAQKVAQIREALAMVERPAAPVQKPAKKGALPPLRKKGTKSTAAKNAAAETVVVPPKPQKKAAPPVQQKNRSAVKPQPAPQAAKQPSKLPPLKKAAPNAQAAKPAAAPAAQTNAAPKPKPLPPLKKAGTAGNAASATKAAPSAKPDPKPIVKPKAEAIKKAAPKKAEPRKPLPIGKISAILGGSAAGALVIAYCVMALVYLNKFLPNTYINNVPVGGMSMEEAREAVLDKADVENLVLVTANGENVSFEAQKFDAEYGLSETALDEAYSENRFLWIRKLFSDSAYTVEYDLSYSEDSLKTMISRHGWGADTSQNAYIAKNEESGMYEIIPATIGDKFDQDILTGYVSEHLKTGEFIVEMVNSGCYDKYLAPVQAEDLKEDLELFNKFANSTIIFDFSDRKEPLEGAQIAEWVSFTADGQMVHTEDGHIDFNRDAIAAFVAAMAEKYDTYGKDRTFRSTLDGVITVPWTSTSMYGWQINQEATVEQIIELLRAGESVTVQPVYNGWGYGFTRETDDIGDTYIEIDISAQHVWYYKDGALHSDSDCVTGTETDSSRRTPRGIFQIWSHESPRKLGTMEKQGYEVWVDYWLPIDYTGIGLHDMQSRSAFGGEIYMYSGSHGCINLPFNFVKELYNTTVNGTPVIVHD